jgi:hypothetical protein
MRALIAYTALVLLSLLTLPACAGDLEPSTAALGMVCGCRNNTLTWRHSSVTPELALYSPAEGVVGTVTEIVIADRTYRVRVGDLV